MATSAVAGYKALMQTSTASGQNSSTVAELTDYTLTTNHAEIDATSHDSSGTREIIAGVDSWEGSATLQHVQDETSHQELHDVLTGKTKLDFVFIPTGSTGDGTFSGSGFVTTYEVTAPNEDSLGANVNFAGTQGLTRNS